MSDIGYVITTKSNGKLAAEYNLQGPNTLRRGEQATFEFPFPDSSDTLTLSLDDLTVSSTYTVEANTIEEYATVTVENGATLTIDGTLQAAEVINNGTITGSGQLIVDEVKRTIESGTVETYETVTVEKGIELVVEGTLQANIVVNGGLVTVTTGEIIATSDGLNQLLQYGDYGGAYSQQETISSRVKIKERLPTDADVDSLILSIEPSDTLKNKDVTGIWAVVDEVTDTRPLSLSTSRLELSVTVLAELSEYSTRYDLEADKTI